MRVKFSMSIGFVGAEREEIFDYDDDVTDKMLDDDWKDWADSYIEGGYEIIDE